MSEENKSVDLKKLFTNLQNQMLSRFKTIDEGIEHDTTKGDASEINWINMLRPYLPDRYKIDKAFVIDSKENISEQQDIVIYDQQFSPSLFNQDETKYVPAESVYAVIEVKQDLKKEHVEYAGKKAASVRKLHRTSAKIIDKGEEKVPRKLFRILAGVVTHTSDWNPPLGDSFDESIARLSTEEQIDFGCVLASGSFRCDYSGSTPKIEKTESNDSAFMFFFLTLLDKLQELGTVPAIDFKEYEKVLKRQF
jgi:hypothetical protein